MMIDLIAQLIVVSQLLRYVAFLCPVLNDDALLIDSRPVFHLVLKFIDDRDFPVSLFLRADFGMVHNDFSMEYFLVYLFAKIVGNGYRQMYPGTGWQSWKPG